ncbi:cupin domain-containing protein [Vibrio caribbeanicus]|uniref:cupin domain-containing protein n=1 Tax=Vibrio caribbeanicus TaxID=701175 RepID=UPI00228362AA|nr:cupin domain-containing protein [Vibrio caribbeanicus]MCY9843402.1 cupin domain-containing protein [Vibrio caribbeanicus]
MYTLNFDLPTFLDQHWHKKPTVIKNAFVDFVDPITPDELAGLAMESDIDSRFINNKQGRWSVNHGPLSEDFFTSLEESHWQLVVQACNHWHSGSATLLEPFKQLPQWLFDDLMVCFSAPQGGVGPHIDQYDVFIVQGRGQRHWKVGARDQGQYKESIQAGALRQIEGFDPIIDQVLEPGDLLYIPPGFPHEGDTLEPSMSYSIGFRSPKQQELLNHFTDYIIANDLGDAHLINPDMAVRSNHGEISTLDKEQLTLMLKSLLDSPAHIDQVIGTLLSQSRHQLDHVEIEYTIEEDALEEHLKAGGYIYKMAGLKVLYHQDNLREIYINGECIACDDPELTLTLSNRDAISIEAIEISPSNLRLLTQLLQRGFWYFDA